MASAVPEGKCILTVPVRYTNLRERTIEPAKKYLTEDLGRLDTEQSLILLLVNILLRVNERFSPRRKVMKCPTITSNSVARNTLLEGLVSVFWGDFYKLIFRAIVGDTRLLFRPLLFILFTLLRFFAK